MHNFSQEELLKLGVTMDNFIMLRIEVLSCIGNPGGSGTPIFRSALK